MLTAFTARPILEIKQRDKSRIESILAYGDRLLVGLQTGSLRIYRVNEPSQDPVPDGHNGEANDVSQQTVQTKLPPVDLLREEEKFSRRAIQQLAIIKEANILISLSDNYVSIHDLQNYGLQERLERTRGATLFAVTSNIVKDPETGIPSISSKLAVAVKRKIILWTWQDMELSGQAVEISLISPVKSLNWAAGARLVAGTDPGFFMVDVESQAISDINKLGSIGEASGQGARFGSVNSSGMSYMGMGNWVPKPMATRLSEGQLLLAKDVNTLFIDDKGKPLEKRQIPWAAAPEAIGYSYPYLLALQSPSKGALEVRNPDTLSLLQTVSLPNAIHLHVPQPYISLAHAGKGFLVASERCIWRMGALDYESQIHELVTKSRYDEAISLLSMLEDTLLTDKDGRLREIRMLKAKGLFEARRYREALDLFSEASAPPERVISLYPRSIAGDLSSIDDSRESENEANHEDTEGAEGNANGQLAKVTSSQSGRLVLGKTKADQKQNPREAGSSMPKRVDSGDTVSIRGKHTENVTPDKPLEGKDLVYAVNELRAFLAQTRVQLQKFINYDGSLKQPLQPNVKRGQEKPPFHKMISTPLLETVDWGQKLYEVAVLVDTTLFRAYMLVSPSLAGSLFRLDNFCDPEVVQEKLYETGRYNDLIDFLHGKKLHRQALELLRQFGKNEADEAVDPALRGPRRTVAYLQQLPPELIDTILEYAEWPLRTDPDLGMKIFLADTENAETLPRGRVLDFLQGIDKGLAVRYLEHIVKELNDLTPDFHQRLIDLYLERLKRKDHDSFANDDERAKWRERLQEFLRSSQQYNLGRAFRLLPSDDPDFYESTAIVLSKMGNHKQALSIYVFKLQDYEKAEEYCNQTYLHFELSPSTAGSSRRTSTADSEDAKPSIYQTLLSLYLSPPPPHKPNWPPALDLLSRHGARLPASSTLDLVPSTLPVKDLESYFRGRIRSANSIVNEERIVSRLRGVEKIAADAALLLGEGTGPGKGGRSRRVVIGEDRICGVCYKRFGGSAIRVLPGNEVVHYGCYGRGKGDRPGLVGMEGMRAESWR